MVLYVNFVKKILRNIFFHERIRDDLMEVENAVIKMVSLHNAKEFTPQQEADVQCLLFHLILQQGIRVPCIHAGFPIRYYEKWIHPDIVIGDPNNIGECDIIEIKFMQKDWDSQPGRITRRMETSKKDLKRLSEIEGKHKFFIFFNEARPLSYTRKKRLLESAGKKVTLIFLEKKDGILISEIYP